MAKRIAPLSPVDENVGMQIQRRRKVLGISEISLAQVLGLTLIDYRKCEIGECRVGAARLLELAKLLNVSPSFFFEGDLLNDELPTSRGGLTLQ